MNWTKISGNKRINMQKKQGFGDSLNGRNWMKENEGDRDHFGCGVWGRLP